jgi:hypothetical protein
MKRTGRQQKQNKRRKVPPLRLTTDPKGWDRDFQKATPPPPKELIQKGCRRGPLLELLQPCVRPDYFSNPRQQELDKLKREFSGLAVQLEKRATVLRDMADKISSGTPAQRASYEDTPEFLEAAANTVSAIAAELRKRQKVIAQQRNVRTTSLPLNFVPLILYCRKATGGKATDREIANLVNAGRQADRLSPPLISERAIAAQLRRAQSKTPEQYKFLETMIERFVASHAAPQGDNSCQTA